MVLGKRKRGDQTGQEESSKDTGTEDSATTLQILFQKHFEAKFKPLENDFLSAKAVQVPTPPSEGSESDWEGLSEDEYLEGPVVVQHEVPQRAENGFNKDELKAFMA